MACWLPTESAHCAFLCLRHIPSVWKCHQAASRIVSHPAMLVPPPTVAGLYSRINGRTSVGPDGRVNRGGLRDSGQTNVAVSLRRDEPLIFCLQYSMQTALCERVVVVYRPDGCKRGTARLVSAERYGYFGCSRSDTATFNECSL